MKIPLSAHVHWPFPIESHPRLSVDLVYAGPAQWPCVHVGGAIAQPGAFAVDDDLATVRLADLSESPERWEGTFRNVSAVIGRLIGERRPPRRRARPETTALTRVLIEHFSREYSAFLDRYRDVACPRPEMPSGLTETERRAWQEMVDRDLAREPRWGDVAQRLFAHEVELFAGFGSNST